MRRGGRQAAVKLACVPISRTILAFLPAAPRQISALNDTSTSAAPRQFAPPLQLLPLIRLLRLKPADTESPDCELQIATFHMQHASEPCLLRQQTSPAVPPHNEPASPARPPWTGALDANEPGLDSKVYESRHVHHVYDQIASHFSSTRYKVCASWNLSIRPLALSSLLPSIRSCCPWIPCRADPCYSHGR